MTGKGLICHKTNQPATQSTMKNGIPSNKETKPCFGLIQGKQNKNN